jgi:beta-1,4-mannosyl-glycoprotein beta-1,4-N-acetylglucosaminyltransferase
MTKIYDCFIFYNELDLLELRLQELYDHVDHFVLVEANRTFQNAEKPLYYQDHAARFKKWADKIIHVEVQDMPTNTDAWGRERYQRDAISRGLVTASEDDIVIVSDLDEIIRPETVDQMKNDLDTAIWGLRMPLFYFKVNYMLTTTDSTYATWAMACRKKLLTSAEDLRRNRFSLNSFGINYNQNGIRMMEHAGWQFSYLGNAEFAKSKIQSFAHVETNRPEVLNSIDIERSIANGNGLGPSPVERFVPVIIDEYMPRTIKNNPDKYLKYTVDNATARVSDFIPF